MRLAEFQLTTLNSCARPDVRLYWLKLVFLGSDSDLPLANLSGLRFW
jgi:hypothetical protein